MARNTKAKGAPASEDGTGSVAEGVDVVRQVARSAARGDGVETTVTGPGGRGAQTGAQIGAQVGSVLGTVVEEVARRAAAAAGSLGEGYGTVRERVEAADPAGLVRQVGGALEGVVGEGRARASQPSRLPAVRSRRSGLPEALGAGLAGAAAGVAIVLVARRLLHHDVPGAQEPEQLRAVVDPTPAVDPSVAAARDAVTGATAPLGHDARPAQTGLGSV